MKRALLTLVLLGCTRDPSTQPVAKASASGAAALSSAPPAPASDTPPATFAITPVRPIEELRVEALAATPPPQDPSLKKPELVELVKLDATIQLDVRYATTNNFVGARLYDEPRAFLQRPAAEALIRVHRALARSGYGLLVHDAYRPWYVTKMFWDATPADKHIYVANPAKGSRHNRGCAVDLTLYELASGKVVEMPSGYDELSERAKPSYRGGTEEQRRRRDLLGAAMAVEGFTVNEEEWWHFDYKDWRLYPVTNLTFDRIGADSRDGGTGSGSERAHDFAPRSAGSR